jgi:Ribonuclease G/E
LYFDIVYESCPWCRRVSLFNEQQKMISLHHDYEGEVFKEGAVIVGRVRRVAEGLGAAFIDIGDIVDGFLSLKKVPKKMGGLVEGQDIVVRIIREKMDDKGATLSANVLHYMPEDSDKETVPYILEEPPVALSRALMNAGVAPVRIWVNDARFRVEALKFVPETKVYQLDQHEDNDLLEKVDESLESLSGEKFNLVGGGMLTIERTKALTSIDVDTGSMRLPNKEELAFQVNMIATEEIVRLCGLLNIGGSVIVDFVSMRSRERGEQVVGHIKDLFSNTDALKVEVLKMSRFGLLEFNRERTGKILLNQLETPRAVAADILLKLWRYKPGAHVHQVKCSTEVADILNARLTPSTAIAYLGRPVEIISEHAFSSRQYNLSSHDVF